MRSTAVVVAHLHEYGRVTNSTVQNLFNVGGPRARQILSSLVERGFLLKTSAAQRGPSVEYGPGQAYDIAVQVITLRQSHGLTQAELSERCGIDQAADLVEQYADLPLGGTDACVVALAERLDIDQIATLDVRHFSVVRASHGRPFVLLPS